MKNIFYKIIIIILVFSNIHSSSYAEWKESKLGEFFVFDFAHSEGETIFYGRPNVFFTSANEGRNWYQKSYPNPYPDDYITYCSINQNKICLVAYSKIQLKSRIYYSEDSGENWDTVANMPGAIPLSAVNGDSIVFPYVDSKLNKSFLTRASLISHNLDTLYSTTTGTLFDSFLIVNDTTWVSGTMNGMMGISRDRGKTWSFQLLNNGRFPRLRVVNNLIWAFSQLEIGMENYFSNDYGKTWKKIITSYVQFAANDICIDKYNNLYLILNNIVNGMWSPSLMKSTDNGQSWEEIFNKTNYVLTSVYVNDYAVFLGTYDGKILWNDAITSVNEDKTDNIEFSIFPNPSSNFISLEDKNQEIKNIKIIDLAGLTLFDCETDNNTLHKINTSSLPSGIYFIVLKTSHGLQKLKFIKS